MADVILIIEDDENDVFFLTDALSNAGVSNPVRVVRDGRQAIEYFKGEGRFSNRDEFPLPCLVLLDLKLPHLSGLDVLAWIRQTLGAGLPVLPLSSSESEADVNAAYRLGANGYLVKPNGISEYLRLAKALKNFWLTQNHAPETNALPPKPALRPAESSKGPYPKL